MHTDARKYTERQKKLITSSECHSLKSKASKWIIFGHKLNLSLISTSKKTKVYFNQRGDKCDEIARGQFSKITETACLSAGLGVRSRQKPVRRLRNPPLKIEWIAIECSEYIRLPPWSSLRARSVSSFYDFRKITCRDLTSFFSFLPRENLVFFWYS